MFRIVERIVLLDDIHLITAYCKSTDIKPTGFATGSFCQEVDTGKAYLYDEDADSGSEWIDQDFEDGE